MARTSRLDLRARARMHIGHGLRRLADLVDVPSREVRVVLRADTSELERSLDAAASKMRGIRPPRLKLSREMVAEAAPTRQRIRDPLDDDAQA